MRILMWTAVLSYFYPPKNDVAFVCQIIVFVVGLLVCAIQDLKEVKQHFK